MISKVDFDNYNKEIDELTRRAAQDTQAQISAWIRLNPDATVAEIRNFAKESMSGIVKVYTEAASVLAARWYDTQAEKHHKKLPSAITAAVYVPDKSKEVAHYQAKKLVKGDIAGFVKSCGEYVSNDTLRALNETIMLNAKRDREEGVRFARVPTGTETCIFCTMLASRGAVYYSRKTAGEFNHFHRGCNCKVVQGYEDAPRAMLVEGHNPDDYLRIYNRTQDALKTGRQLYKLSKEEIEAEVQTIADGLSQALASFKQSNRTAKDYQDTVGKFVSSFSDGGKISIDDFTKIEAKELQIASFLSSLGRDILFRNPDYHLKKEGNTSDLRMDDKLWEIKRVESANPNKIARRIFEKPNQGPNYIIDLSVSKMKLDQAICKAAYCLEDNKVNQILIVHNGKIYIVKK